MAEWNEVVEDVAPHVVRVLTPQGSGTGFLVSRAAAGEVCGIATAEHVIAHANFWEQPIRIEHPASGKSMLLRAADRAIFPDGSRDTAGIVFQSKDLPLPDQPFDLAPEGKWLKVGSEIGWLGFPAVAPGDMCFFSGRVSVYRERFQQYLVDGVAINGVSGGPAFWNGGNRITLIGVLSAYIANRATGETLPGVAVVASVEQFHGLVKMINSLDEAKEKEIPPPEPKSAPESQDSPANPMGARKAS